ncbi:11473_t:CDS:10 [Entrophospora sp. SA101]|nr:11473_t:CDS:10 [Entrophospora sp. SA101]
MVMTGEQKVEVNQRNLIDKVLARYSAEFVIYRELMQNSDDAQAKTVQITFETDKSKKCRRIIFKNNGFLFRDEDWNRLKKIAEGNPDVEKIGAFGVGFYSLFSICEEPFISSGTQGMAFYWRNDQLFSKMGGIKQDDMIWTTFLMDTRRKENLPNIGYFGRFLATSLGFTRNLRKVIVYFNDTEVIHLTKETNKSLSINMDIGLNKFSPKNMFRLKSVDVCNVRLHFRGLIGPEKSQISQSTSLKIACGNLGVDVSKSFSEEMEFATKKKPPNNTTIQMIFTGHDERNLPGNSNKEILNIFKDLTPFPDQGRIFIGFPTHQTTGCSVHLAARVIPTVERESIDLVHKTLSVYNKEMLCSAGILARIVYDDEMNQISRLCMDIDPKLLNSDDKQDKKGFEYLQECSVHILQHFTFKTSTPNNMVAKIIESQFFDCTKKSLQILSTHGVLPINSVRIPNKEVVSFIKTIPMVPFSLFTECSEFFTIAKDILKCISEISMDDVFEELKRRQFNNKELSDLFKWWIGYRSKNDITDEQFRKFMCLVSIGDDLTPLNHIRYFLNPHVIPPTIEVPPDVLPYSISKPLRKEDLEAHFGNWTELTILTWTQYIFTKPGIDDPDFAEKILRIISHQFKNLSKSDLKAIKKIMAKKRCIPTVSGMKLPKESYFPDVKLLPDLPNVNLKQHKTKNLDEFLLFIGVKKHVELQLVFDQLFNKGSWDHMELIKYLTSIDLGCDDIEKLETSVIWPIESGNETQKFTAKELYAPLPKLIELELPIIKWKGRFYKNTKEGKFILKLGLREYPPLDEILKLASNSPIRQKAFEYFLDNFRDKYAKDYDARSINVPFLPCMDPNVYSEPSKCFFNPECAIMGFNVLRKDLRCRAEELGVVQNPDHSQLSDKLIKELPENEEKAKLVFEFLFSCTSSSDSTAFSKLKFIPTRDKDLPNTFKYNLPQDCFFMNSEEERYVVFFGKKYSRLSKRLETFDENISHYFEKYKIEYKFDVSPEYFQPYLKVELDSAVEINELYNCDCDENASNISSNQLLLKTKSSDSYDGFKLVSSKKALDEFLKFNAELISMKKFQYVNAIAMSKILKKHDKKTCLTASPNFLEFIKDDFDPMKNISKSLFFLIQNQLITIIPQPEDYSCIICTFVYWKPIRLCCGHVFCVRCLIKSEAKGMKDCPVCREKGAIRKADAGNIDKSLMNFLKLYFPKEVKQKISNDELEEIDLIMNRRISQ